MDRNLARRNLRTAYHRVIGLLMFALTFVAALVYIMSELEHRAVPPAGEEIHMPAPSIIPLINAAALALAIVSITLSWYMVALGGIVFLVTTVRWIADVRRDIAELPLDHHH